MTDDEDLIVLAQLAVLAQRYVELSGEVIAVSKQVGPAGKDALPPEHQWDGTKLRFRKPAGDWGKWVDLIGPKGKQGNKGEEGKKGVAGRDGMDGADGVQGDAGPMGLAPDHQWKGTKLRFQKPDGTWGKWVDLKGEDGKKGAGSVWVGGGGGNSGEVIVEYNGYFPMGW